MLKFGGLTEADFSEMGKSWIDPQTALAADLRRCDDHQGRQIFGGNERAARAGLLFPYYVLDAQSQEIRGFRVRRDAPEMEKKKDGSLRPVAKYLAVKGSPNMLYVPPAARAWLHADIPVVIVEGEKKTLALWRLAQHGQAERTAPRWVPIGVSGVWNWRGAVGEATDHEGGIHALKGPIPDWAQLDLEARKVTIVFDADVRTNQNIRAAREKLAEFLVDDCRAEVLILDIPKAAKQKGVDDWIADAGPDAVLAEWQPKPWRKERASTAAVGDVLADVRLFRTETREAYACVVVDDHEEVMPVQSQDFLFLLVRRMMKKTDEVPGEDALAKMVRRCMAVANAAPPTENVFVRLGSLDAAAGFSLDLGGPRWQAVNVSRDGWRVGRPVCKFQRSTAMLELPEPQRGGSWDLLKPLINSIDRENFVLMVAWLVGALAPFGPYPILMISGEKGSAKSTTAENLRRLIDPVKAGRRSLPDDERSLLIEAMNTWIVGFDNLSGLSRKVSDWLCRISTGGGSSQRRLHSNNEQVILSATRPMVLNGIVDLGTYPDLLSRGLACELPKMPESMRAAERDIDDMFRQSWPKLLGLLLDAAVAALRHFGEVRLKEVPRMADFTRWVVAAAMGGSLPFTSDEFLRCYELNRRIAFTDTLEAAPFARAIQRLMDVVPEFDGTAEQLRLVLVEKLGKEVERYRWASSNQALGNELKDMADVVREGGFVVERYRAAGGNRPKMIRIRPVSAGTGMGHSTGQTEGESAGVMVV